MLGAIDFHFHTGRESCTTRVVPVESFFLWILFARRLKHKLSSADGAAAPTDRGARSTGTFFAIEP